VEIVDRGLSRGRAAKVARAREYAIYIYIQKLHYILINKSDKLSQIKKLNQRNYANYVEEKK